MGLVLSGQYDGGKVKFTSEYKCLYIKYRGRIIPLDSLRVASCTLKEMVRNPYVMYDRVFLIRWHDGSKSLIGVEKPYMTWLIAGCETAELDDDDAKSIERNSTRWVGTVLGIAVALVVIWLINTVLLNSGAPSDIELHDGATIKNDIKVYELNHFSNTDVNGIEAYEDETGAGYDVIGDFSWNGQGSKDEANEIISDYCDELAAYIFDKHKTLSRLYIFWAIPNLTLDTRSACSYERNGDDIDASFNEVIAKAKESMTEDTRLPERTTIIKTSDVKADVSTPPNTDIASSQESMPSQHHTPTNTPEIIEEEEKEAICHYREKYGDTPPADLAKADPEVIRLYQLYEEKKTIAYGFDPVYAHEHREEYINAQYEARDAYSAYTTALQNKRYEFINELAQCAS